MEKKVYKPKIGKRIYFILEDFPVIVEEEVGYVGADSFVIAYYDIKVFTEFFYEDYKEKWFTNLNDAKKKCKELHGAVEEIHFLDDCIGGE